MAIQNRATVVAIKKETTEGTPVLPTAATDYIPIEDDFSLSPSFDSLENAELKNSLGPAKPIQGLENPEASFGLYLKNSGTGGTAPNYGHLLEAAFGSVDDAGVEHDTVSSSTTTLIKVNTGEGATYQKGQLLLIKDGVNGYSIRPVHSISSNDLTLGFAISVAPAANVLLGEAVMYRPASSGHPSITVTQYLGNGGAIQVLAGGRVTEVSISFAAGELINASYSVGGTSYYFNPIEITATSKYMDFNIGASELNASVTAKLYKDPHDLAAAVQTAMLALAAGITVTYSNTTGKFTIVKASGTLELLWNTGANTANTIGTKLGFVVSADDTGGLTYTSDNAMTLTATHTPTFDSADPLVAKNNVIYIGDQTDNVCFAPSTVDFTLSLDKTDILSVCAESGKAGSVISKRTATVSVTALLSQYDADKFRRYRENTETRFFYAFGEKSGGNWVAGKSGGIYSPTMTITSFELADADGLVVLNLELTAFVNNSGDPEIYLGFV